ncbi:MAG: hypothetical protein EBY39_03290 [Flavobacteriia bacterium]|nr:hypothetical protein [Flavobacteriia bacterium]
MKAESHTHTVSDIVESDGTTLQSVLDDKADLGDDSRLLLTQLPAGVDVKAMKFVGVTGNLGASGSAVNLSTQFSLDSLSTTALDQKLGDYKIATNTVANRFIKEHTSGNNSYEFILSPDATDDDQSTSTTEVEIEAGDRIVFVKYTGDSTNGFTFSFAVINSVHIAASTGNRGTVSLSNVGQTLDDYSTSNSNRHLYAVDEKSLRDAMKDQRTIVEFTQESGSRTDAPKYWATSSSNLPSASAGSNAPSNGDFALVGTSATTKDVWSYDTQFGSGWADTSFNVTFPSNYIGFPSGFDANDIVYYDAQAQKYIYKSGSVTSSCIVFSEAANTANSTKLPADGDLVYYISP